MNLPKIKKLSPAKYQGFQKEQIPFFVDQENKVRVNIIAGNFQNLKGVITTHTPINAFTADIKEGGKISFDIPESHNTFIYVLNGVLSINGNDIIPKLLVHFEQAKGSIEIESKQDSTILLMSGEPINEKVVSWGPYVMNSQTEILEAMRDYQMGKMGVLLE